MLDSIFIKRHGDNDDIVSRYLEGGEFKAAAFKALTREIFNTIRANEGPQTIESMVAAGE